MRVCEIVNLDFIEVCRINADFVQRRFSAVGAYTARMAATA